MAVVVEKLSNESIIIVAFHPPLDMEVDYKLALQQLVPLVEGEVGPIYRLMDLSQCAFSFGDMAVAMAEEVYNKAPGAVTDPRIRMVMVMQQQDLMQIGSNALQTDMYGNQTPPPAFNTVEEALNYVRTQPS
jgi:hypothetical protein